MGDGLIIGRWAYNRVVSTDKFLQAIRQETRKGNYMLSRNTTTTTLLCSTLLHFARLTFVYADVTD